MIIITVQQALVILRNPSAYTQKEIAAAMNVLKANPFLR